MTSLRLQSQMLFYARGGRSDPACGVVPYPKRPISACLVFQLLVCGRASRLPSALCLRTGCSCVPVCHVSSRVTVEIFKSLQSPKLDRDCPRAHSLGPAAALLHCWLSLLPLSVCHRVLRSHLSTQIPGSCRRACRLLRHTILFLRPS